MAGSGPPAADSGGGVGFILRALRYRNYRLFFGGQIVSLTGTWITTTATSWLVYRLTGSTLLLGVIGFASQVPSFVLTPFAGIFVDRWNRHRLLVVTQILLMAASFVLAGLTLSRTISIPWLIAVSVFTGVVTAFDMPGRQAFVVTLIENKNDLGNAIALNSSMFNAARLVGPSVAGVIIAASDEGWCYLIDGISYLSVIGALLRMRVPAPERRMRRHESPLAQFHEGWRYAYQSRPIRNVILLVALLCLGGVPYTVLMPVFAATVLHGGPHTLGFLMTSTGAGALLGALWLASRPTVHGINRNIPVAGTVFSCGLLAFSQSRVLWMSSGLLVITGFGLMVLIASSNTLIQTVVEDGKRGRVMSFFLMAYFGTTPFGSLAAGAVSDRIGAPATTTLGALMCLASVVWFGGRLARLPMEPHVARSHATPISTSPIAASRDAV
jgi:MFS family permease